MPVSIIVGTYGAPAWVELAAERALPSARAQDDVEVIHVHADTLHDARNEGAAKAAGDWLIFLDADDELAPGYVRHMRLGRGDLRTPSVAYVQQNGKAGPARLLRPRPLRSSSYLVIGTMVRRGYFEEAGGFQDWPAYEDWALFLRCDALGAKIRQVPRAVYRAHVNPEGRNKVTDGPTLCKQILDDLDRWKTIHVGVR